MGVSPNVVAHTGPRPTNLAGPGMVPYGMPPQPPSSQMDSGIYLISFWFNYFLL